MSCCQCLCPGMWQCCSHSTNKPPACVSQFWATWASFHLHKFQTHLGNCSFVNPGVMWCPWGGGTDPARCGSQQEPLHVPFNPGPACSSYARAGAPSQCSLDSIGRKVSHGRVDAIFPAGTAKEACTQVGELPVDTFVAGVGSALVWLRLWWEWLLGGDAGQGQC